MISSTKSAARKGELSGARLLELAADLFREHGYAVTTMRDIAEAAGMKAGSLYYHFSSKDEILDQVLERGIGETIRGFEAALAQLGPDADFAARFRAAVTAHLRTVAEYGTYTVASRQLLKHIPEPMHQKHVAMRLHYDELWRDLLHEGVQAGVLSKDADLSLIRLFLLGSLNWTSEWLDPTKKSYDELGAMAADLFLKGLNSSPPR